MNILLFGGSFDPFHNGHLNALEIATRSLPPLDKIMVIPAFISPGKKPCLAPPDQRILFAKIGVGEVRATVSAIEIERRAPSYTVDTIHCFRAEFPTAKIFWLLGGDSYAHFSQWREPDEIRRLATLVVMSRPGSQTKQQDPRDILLEGPENALSSSELREQLSQGKIPPDAFPKSLEKHLKILLLNGQNPYVSL